MARALTYAMLAFVVPLVWAVRANPPPYPWLADLLLTLACFTDVLGNRLDLYDTVGWFDDLVHVAVPGILTAAFLLLTGPVRGFGRALERAIAFGLSASLAWELFEYSSHVTRSTELPLAYADTLGDLSHRTARQHDAAEIEPVSRRPRRHRRRAGRRPRGSCTARGRPGRPRHCRARASGRPRSRRSARPGRSRRPRRGAR